MKRIAIIGSGDLAQLIAQHAQQCNLFNVVGFYNDFEPLGKTINNIPIIGKTTDVLSYYQNKMFDGLLIGIGYNHLSFRKKIFDTYYNLIPFEKLLHPSAYIDKSVLIGEGTVIFPGCVLDANVKIGNNVLLNTSVTIAHDSVIQNHTFISPRVAIAGFSNVGECCNIGINTTIIDNINITDNVKTGGGAVVTKPILESGLYVGVPAKKIK
jgi:sugar O-acyltransferase (sialic acid O-acetyltransferase NeuD family)